MVDLKSSEAPPSSLSCVVNRGAQSRSEELDTKRIFLAKDLRFATLNQNLQALLQQFGIHPMEFYFSSAPGSFKSSKRRGNIP
jgi:hypothetical protein